jgi:hypothetical protein
MAGFTRENGDAAQVGHLDVPAYSNTGIHWADTVGKPVQPAGPKLIFITGDLGGDPTFHFGPGGAIEALLKVVQQLTTVHMYQFNADGTYRIAAYDCGTDLASWTAEGDSLQDEIQALGEFVAPNNATPPVNQTLDLAAATAALGSLA